jgi:hypothetical protein
MGKYRPGKPIKTMSELAKEIDAGRIVYLRHKPQNPGWLRSMTYHSLQWFVHGGSAFKALENKK